MKLRWTGKGFPFSLSAFSLCTPALARVIMRKMPEKTALVSAYQAALLDYLQRSDESALAHAYDLGRSGFESGCGLLQMLQAHDQALRVILDGSASAETHRRIAASATFLLEALSPYEMASGGYRDVLKAR